MQDDITIVADHLDLIIGGRFTYAKAGVDKYQNPDTGLADAFEKSWDNVVGSARLLWNIDGEDHWNIYAGISQGFRTPNLSDLTRRDAARSGEAEIGSTDLDPEEYVQSEIGIKSQFRNWSWSAAYWYTNVNGMILRAPTGAVDSSGDTIVTKRNVGDGYLQGVEFSSS